MIDTAAVNQMIARLAEAPKGAKADGRKVRTPQGSAPGNARSGQPEGKWHRKYTAFDAGSEKTRPTCVGRVLSDPPPEVRVKRCGKSAPRPWQHGWQAKPRTEQDQIGRP